MATSKVKTISFYRIKWKFRHTTSPMMSQSKLEKVLPLIQSAAKIFVNEDGISETKEYETKAFCQKFTVKAIMSSGFNIGKTYHTVHNI